MKLIVTVIVLLPSLALAQPLPQPKPPGGGSCPHGYTSSGSFCVPREGAVRRPALGRAAGRFLLPVGFVTADQAHEFLRMHFIAGHSALLHHRPAIRGGRLALPNVFHSVHRRMAASSVSD